MAVLQSNTTDPLVLAVESGWDAGITVVAAASTRLAVRAGGDFDTVTIAYARVW
jgi:hypothetical protein